MLYCQSFQTTFQPKLTSFLIPFFIVALSIFFSSPVSYAAVNTKIYAGWKYTSSPPPADLVGFRIYNNGSMVYEVKDPLARQLTIDLRLDENIPQSFTITAFSTENESPHSSVCTITLETTPPSTAIPRNNWSVHYVNSEETNYTDLSAERAFDGDPTTHWHTEWYLNDPIAPHEIQIDLGESYDIEGFRYLPRQGGNPNGRIGQYEFYVSTDGVNWKAPVASGLFTNNATEKEILFFPKTGRYIRLRALTEVNGNPWTSMAEINVLGQIPSNNTTGDIIDTCTFNVNDGIVNSNTATVMVSITPSESLSIEFGEVNIDHKWTHVSFIKPFIDPIVVVKLASYNGTDPSVVRIMNVDGNGFEIRIQEWDYLDGSHVIETISYIAIECGSYTLDDGTVLEANKFSTDKTNSFDTVSFAQSFNVIPVVTAAVTSFNETDAVTNRLQNIDTTGFEFMMQEQELNVQTRAAETISYIAWEPSAGTVNGITYEVAHTDDNLTHDWSTIIFKETFSTSPVFLADMQTTDGRDTASLRYIDKDAFSVDLIIEEETSSDNETNHSAEIAGYIALHSSN